MCPTRVRPRHASLVSRRVESSIKTAFCRWQFSINSAVIRTTNEYLNGNKTGINAWTTKTHRDKPCRGLLLKRQNLRCNQSKTCVRNHWNQSALHQSANNCLSPNLCVISKRTSIKYGWHVRRFHRFASLLYQSRARIENEHWCASFLHLSIQPFL